jgi:hypothetical protein
MMKKTCTKCGETKPLEGYHRSNTGGKFGYTSECKVCHTKRCREYRARRRQEKKK